MVLKGRGLELNVDPYGGVRVIGERINPSGKPALRKALIDGDWDAVAREAQAQVKAGAAIIDVNVGGKGVDETATLPRAVRAVVKAVDVPLCIDTRIPAALEAALAACPGRPLVNSISAEEKALQEILPIVAGRHLPVIVLCMGQEGIPVTPEGRLECARRARAAAIAAGIDATDIIFDPLVMTVGADDKAARLALETVRLLREEFPANSITGGTSNVSFGMPARSRLNACFLPAAAMRGLNLPITDPTDGALRFALLACNIFLGCDAQNRSFMKGYRELKAGGQIE
jgi:5-methyltetrahydrofolate--homocysteine methyltransferase